MGRAGVTSVIGAIIALALLLPAAATPADGASRAPAPAAQRYFASIAVDRYSPESGARPLKGAVGDAKALAAAFESRLAFATRADGESLSRHDAQATAAGIKALTKRGGPLDQLPDDALLVVYVALHGQSRACGADEEGVRHGVCGAVLPHDRPWDDALDIEWLLRRLNGLSVRHVLLLLDTCDSGMALGALQLERVRYTALKHPSATRKSRKVITAAALEEPADDGDAAQGRRGRFAETLLAGLSGEADLFPDGNLLFVELAIYLQTEVARRSLADDKARRQQPEFGGFLSDGHGTPSLGALTPVESAAEGDADGLLDAAKQHLADNEPHRAQGVLARYLLALRHRARTPQRIVGEARALAARGEHAAAMAKLDALRRVAPLPRAQEAAIGQYQARLAQAAGDLAEAERRADAARQAALDAGSGLDARGQGALVDAMGAVATAAGAERAAAALAEAALPLVGPESRRAVAGDGAEALDAVGEVERAKALREAEGARPAPPDAAEATRFRPALVSIAPGEFTMGSPEDEVGRDSDERAHRVTLTRGFLMAETEVTQAQYTALMGENPAWFQGAPADGARPVEQVSWLDAVRYCNALSAAEGLQPAYAIEGAAVTWRREADGYRLPTEAEWEFAARAGTATATYAGDLDLRGGHDAPVLDGMAWYGGNSGSDHRRAFNSSAWPEKQYDHARASTHPVKGKRPNAWGLYDMLGNVWEWTWDRYAIYPPSRDGAPQADPAGPADGVVRVFRGGSFVERARNARAADRWLRRPVNRDHDIGFRPVRAPRAPGP